MSHFNWSKAHLAAHKRPATVTVRRESHRISATSQTLQNLLSLFSYDQNSPKTRKSQEHRAISTNPSFFQNQTQVKFSEIYGSSQRFNAESSSLSQFPLQFKREFTTGSGELKRDRRGRLRRRRKENSTDLNR